MPGLKVAIFLDGSNFYYALKNGFGRTDIDMAKVSSVLAAGRELVRTYYYNAAYPSNHAKARKQQQFFQGLRRTPYLEVRLGQLQLKEGVLVQKGVDVKLAVEMIDFGFRNTYDTAILVSGDSDFVPAVQFVKNLGKHVELVVVQGQPSWHLQDACDKTVVLEQDSLTDCWLKA